MTYRDVLVMKSNLDQVNFIQGADARFVYAVAKNKARLESIIKVMSKMIDPGEGIVKFRDESDALNQEFAERDPDGTVGYINLTSHGSTVRAYRKIIGDGNSGSDHGKRLNELKEMYKADLEKHEVKIKTYNMLLDTELPEEEYRRHMIDLEIIPAGLHPLGMSGCLEFIRE